MCNKRIISASIVLYNPDIEQVQCVIDSYVPSENRFLYLIDNSPIRMDIELFLNSYTCIQYYFTGENKGYGAGHNIAIKMAIQANSQYHVVLNPDLQFKPEIIDKIVDFMDSDDSIAQVMPKIVNQQGDIQYLCKLIPNPFDLLVKRFLPQFISEKNAVKYQLKFTNYDKKMNVPYLSGCFMCFRTEVFESVEMFDECFFMYPEDIDITRRIHKLFKTMYYPDVSIIHAHKAESYKNIRMFSVHIINIIKYFNKWGWFFDKDRREINKKVLKELGYRRI